MLSPMNTETIPVRMRKASKATQESERAREGHDDAEGLLPPVRRLGTAVDDLPLDAIRVAPHQELHGVDREESVFQGVERDPSVLLLQLQAQLHAHEPRVHQDHQADEGLEER